MLQIIPAIDLRGGRCVRLLRGEFGSEQVYSKAPVEVALRWEAEGARWLHVVDLDGAKEGSPHHLEVVAAICRAVSTPVQLGGGIRRLEDAERALSLGVGRVVIGTAAVENPDTARLLFERLGEQAALALDVRGNQIATRGWLSESGMDYIQFAQRMESLGARRFIFTSVNLDGTLSGVETEPIRRLLEAVQVPVIASGGVGSLEDIRHLKALTSHGLEGVIIGRAFYEGIISLSEAVQIAK